MIESMVTAIAHNIGQPLRGKEPRCHPPRSLQSSERESRGIADDN